MLNRPQLGRALKGGLLMITTISSGIRPVYGEVRVRPALSEAVKVCQVGYLPSEAKHAMLTDSPTADVIVRRLEDDSIALMVTASASNHDADSGDDVRSIDFSKLRAPGHYYLDVPGLGASHTFQIADDAFAKPFRLAMRSFYGQRCGIAVNLAPDFPQYHYAACHTAIAHFHPSAGKSGEIEISGGWHDAGDFGRYIVNSGITTGTLLWAYELNADKLAKIKLDIPESGGALPDMLAEIKWNLDWMLKMQDAADGGVWHKATSEHFCGFVMPPDDPLPAVVIGGGSAPFKGTTATADFAAVCAIASRVYRPFDGAYADRCLAAAEHAWKWLETNPTDNAFENPPGVGTGGYGDGDASDERLWAASELFRTTGSATYNDYFLAHHAKFTITDDSPQGWPNVQNLALYTYAMSGRAEAKAEVVAETKTQAIDAADGIAARINRSGYRVPLTSDQYVWGSNGVVANYAMMLRLAHRFDPKPEYVDAAQDALHYLLGRNHFNTSFVTHVGEKYAMHPHHRASAADGIDEPWPGLLVGGPNSHQGNREKDKSKPAPPPATVWHDDQNDYVTNENAINWNAPLVFVLAEALP